MQDVFHRATWDTGGLQASSDDLQNRVACFLGFKDTVSFKDMNEREREINERNVRRVESTVEWTRVVQRR